MLKIILGILALVVFCKMFVWALSYDDSEEYDTEDNEDK